MSLEAIALSCFIVLTVVIIGYLFTAVEFKHMADHPEDFNTEEDLDEIHLAEQ